MRKLIKIALIAFGIRAALRWWKRRQADKAIEAPAPPAQDPAEELRQKLAGSREDAMPDEPAEPPATPVTERRAEVHEQGRAALDEMKSTDES